jgi:DNA-binding transcriptional ArsR family regulator
MNPHVLEVTAGEIAEKLRHLGIGAVTVHIPPLTRL